ncbi:tyrosine-type recombinase/integrase [Oleidesulfovibrio alaskensis]
MSVGQTPAGIWYTQYRMPGQKVAKKEYFGKGPAGEKKAKLRDLDVKKAKVQGVKPVSTEMYLDELGQRYVDWLKNRKCSPEYTKNVARWLNREWVPQLKHKPVAKLEYDDFEPFHRLYAHLSPNTKAHYLAVLCGIFKYGVNMGWLARNPMNKWATMNKVETRRRKLYLTFEDFNKIVQHAMPHLKFALLLMWELGARPGPSELFKLKWSDVNWEENTINIRGSKTSLADRKVPVSPEFMEVLRDKQKEARTEYLNEYKGRPIKRNVRSSLRKAVKAAGIQYPVFLYQVRHLYASEMLKEGADMKAVASLLGHKSLKMIMSVYYHEIVGEKEKAIKLKPKLVGI